MKNTRLIFILKYNNGFTQYDKESWYLPMHYFKGFFGNTILVKRIQYEK